MATSSGTGAATKTKKDFKRGPWNTTEDERLRALIGRYGIGKWVEVADGMIDRSAKQCRERWHQNLDPIINHEPITEEEGMYIEYMVAQGGRKWADIARSIPGRSDNSVKNWWNGGNNRRKREYAQMAGSGATAPAGSVPGHSAPGPSAPGPAAPGHAAPAYAGPVHPAPLSSMPGPPAPVSSLLAPSSMANHEHSGHYQAFSGPPRPQQDHLRLPPIQHHPGPVHQPLPLQSSSSMPPPSRELQQGRPSTILPPLEVTNTSRRCFMPAPIQTGSARPVEPSAISPATVPPLSASSTLTSPSPASTPSQSPYQQTAIHDPRRTSYYSDMRFGEPRIRESISPADVDGPTSKRPRTSEYFRDHDRTTMSSQAEASASHSARPRPSSSSLAYGQLPPPRPHPSTGPERPDFSNVRLPALNPANVAEAEARARSSYPA